jgi:hypothetical protein
MRDTANLFLRTLLLMITVLLHGILVYLLFTTDAIDTLILRSNIYLAMLVLMATLYRLQRADNLRSPAV